LKRVEPANRRVHDPAEVAVRPGPGMPPDIAARMEGKAPSPIEVDASV
jgi:hypothetical protein